MKNENIFRKLHLTILSVFVIVVFLKTPAIYSWINNIILPKWQNLKAYMQKDPDERKLARWGNSYYASINIKKYCDENNIKDAVILFEPNEYYKEINFDFKVPEPITFYYFTGMRGMWITSKHINEATHFVTINQKSMEIHEITSQEVLTIILNKYKEYKTSL